MKKKPNHPYYNIQELLDVQWNEFPISEKILLEWALKGWLQFSVWLTPPSKQFFMEIECGYTEYEKDSSYRLPMETKQIHYGQRKLFRLSPITIDQLLNPALKGKAQPNILTNCEWCEEKCELFQDRDSKNVYTSYEMFPCNSAKSSPELSNQDLYWPTITKDDLVVDCSEVIRFGDILERDYSAQTNPLTDNDSGNNKLSEPTSSTSEWHGQVEPVEFSAGTEKNKIVIRFKNRTDIEISTAGSQNIISKSFESLGFRNNQQKKAKEWNQAWLLLHDIAKNNGVFSRKDIFTREGQIDGSQNEKVVRRFRDTLKKINDRLRYAIPTFGDIPPIKFNKKQDRWESCFTLGLTPSFHSELNDQTPNTDNDTDILMLMTNRQGHIHDRSTSGIEDHDIKD